MLPSRAIPVATLVLTLVLGGCGLWPAQRAPQAAPPQSETWALIAPPDNRVVLAMLETTRALPRNGDRLPSRRPTEISDGDWREVEVLFDDVRAQPSARAKADYLIERSADRGAPLAQWREVRRFDSAEKCRTTRQELIDVTNSYSDDLGVQPGMHKDDLQWPMMAWGFRWSQCVPR